MLHRVPNSHMIGVPMGGWETCFENRTAPTTAAPIKLNIFVDHEDNIDQILNFLRVEHVHAEKQGTQELGFFIAASGPHHAIEQLFDTRFYRCTCDCCGTFLATDQPARAPVHVVHIDGFSTYPVLSTRSIRKSTVASQPDQKNHDVLDPNISPHGLGGTYRVTQLMEHYSFPSFTAQDGKGVTVGILQFGGGYKSQDISLFLNSLAADYPYYSTVVPNITAVSVDGGTNNPNDPDQGSNLEVNLDIQILLACAPAATFRVYFAPNQLSSFYNAIYQAVTDGCSIISISWGAPEINFPNRTVISNLIQSAANQGVTVTAAAGDNGSNDGLNASGSSPVLHVDFPGSSPWATCCGGTTFTGGNAKETVWNDNDKAATGGGVSKTFSKPSYQDSITFLNSTAFRGVPDISANADPEHGYQIYMNGAVQVVGGTSCVSPLFAGLVAQIAGVSQKRYGAINVSLYESASANKETVIDIVSGNNVLLSKNAGFYNAGKGWDACTGLGTFVGTKLAENLGAFFPPIPPKDEKRSSDIRFVFIVFGAVFIAISLVSLLLIVFRAKTTI